MNEARRPCDLTGEVDDIVVTQIYRGATGRQLRRFLASATPYYKIKTDTRPVHAPEGRVGYRQWLGLVYPAPMDLNFRRRRSSKRRRVCATSTRLTGETRG